MICRTFCLLSIFLLFCAPYESSAASLDDLVPTVVFLHGIGTATTVESNSIHEVWLKHPDTGKMYQKKQPVAGTGFLVVTKSNHMYLVTAEHVARPLTPDCAGTLRTGEDQPYRVALKDLIGNTNALAWVVHESADVAVLPLDPVESVLPHLSRHFLPLEWISDKKDPPPRHIPLTALGFPLTLGAQGKFSPISRESKPASGFVTIPRADTKTPCVFFLLEKSGIGGFSGAPLYDLAGGHFTPGGGMVVGSGKPTCIGVVHGSIGDRGGQMAAVTPSYFVVETISKAEKQRASKKANN